MRVQFLKLRLQFFEKRRLQFLKLRVQFLKLRVQFLKLRCSFLKKLHCRNGHCIAFCCKAALQGTGNGLAVLPQMAVFTGNGTAHGLITTKTRWSFTEKGVDWHAFLSFWALIRNGSLLTILGLNWTGGRLQFDIWILTNMMLQHTSDMLI